MGFEAKTANAFELLHRDILNGCFAPDAPLRVAALSARYGVSATPLREALSRLAEKRMVVAAANCGWRVAPVSLAEFEDLQLARLTVEAGLLRDAMDCGGIDWEAGIVAAHYRLAQAVVPTGPADTGSNRQNWITAHDQFHEALLAAARSDWLKLFQAQLAEQALRHHQAVLFHAKGDAVAALRQAALSVPRHTELMEAALSRNWGRAEQTLTDHVAQGVDIYRAILGVNAPARAEG